MQDIYMEMKAAAEAVTKIMNTLANMHNFLVILVLQIRKKYLSLIVFFI